jgi:hypothetical protein
LTQEQMKKLKSEIEAFEAKNLDLDGSFFVKAEW